MTFQCKIVHENICFVLVGCSKQSVCVPSTGLLWHIKTNVRKLKVLTWVNFANTVKLLYVISEGRAGYGKALNASET